MGRLAESLDALKQLASEKGYWPSTSEWNAYAVTKQYLSAMSITRNTDKKWEQLRENFGFPPKNKRFSKNDVILSLQKAAADVGGNLTLKKYIEWQKRNHDAVTSGRIERLFGSFNNAKKAAGLPVVKSYRKKYTIKEVEQALIDCANELGLYSNAEYEKWVKNKASKGVYYPSLSVVINMVDSVPDTKRKLGIPTYERYEATEKISLEEVKRSLYEFVCEKLGPKAYRKWAVERGKPSPSTLENYGGYYKLIIDAMNRYSDKIKEDLQ